MIIYIVRNPITGLSYIGKTTKSLDSRWEQHLADTRNGSTNYFHRAIRKYGTEVFVRELVCECEEVEGNLLERFCIFAFETRTPRGYNMTDGGDGVPGYVFTAEDRKKLGSGWRGKKRPPRSEEWCGKLSKSGKERFTNPEQVAIHKAGTEKRLANPAWRENHAKAMAKRSGDPVWQKKWKENIEKLKNHPTWLENVRKASKRKAGPEWSEKMLVRSAKPEWIEKQKQGSRKRSDSYEWKANHAKMVASPEYRAKLKAAQIARRQRERLQASA